MYYADILHTMCPDQNTIRIGCGSGYAGDSPHAATTLVSREDPDYLCCDRLAERTLSNAMLRKRENQSAGYDLGLKRWFRTVLPECRERSTTIIGNFGAANPSAAGAKIAEIAAELDWDCKIMTITGDDILDSLDELQITASDTDKPFKFDQLDGDVISANVYLGTSPIVDALEEDADIIIGGRIADMSLFLAPMIYEFDWGEDESDKRAAGVAVSHLLECGRYSTGGNLAYPGYVDVPALHNLGLPYADVEPTGEAVISKPDSTGGVVSELSLATQLCYEVHNPAKYITPDVVADFSDVELEQLTEDEVRVSGATGRPLPTTLKVMIGVDGGFIVEDEKSWAGEDSLARARTTIEERVKPVLDDLEFIEELRIDYIGVDSVFGPEAREPECEPNEMRVRIAAKVPSNESAEEFLAIVDPLLTNGAVGAGSHRPHKRRYLALHTGLTPREQISAENNYRTPGEVSEQ
jgi:hypothetical protein